MKAQYVIKKNIESVGNKYQFEGNFEGNYLIALNLLKADFKDYVRKSHTSLTQAILDDVGEMKKKSLEVGFNSKNELRKIHQVGCCEALSQVQEYLKKLK